MTSGNKRVEVSLSGEFQQEDFTYHHQMPACDGAWGILIQQNVPYPLVGLGTALLPLMAFVACPKCKAAYALPGFQDLVEKSHATNLVISERILHPKEIKFLRLTFGLTQQEVIDAIEMESVSYYSKCETGKPGFALSPDKQVRLKILFATKLGINRAEDYHRINLTSGKREQTENAPVLNFYPGLKLELEKLTEEFKSQFHLSDLVPVKRA